MKDKILIHINDPKQLEKLYRADKSGFKRAFTSLYPELEDRILADYWNERLNYVDGDISWGSSKDLITVLIAVVLAGLLAKLPAFLPVDEAFFYTRNTGFIVFPLLSAYFAWKNRLSPKKMLFPAGIMLVGLLVINFLPNEKESDTLLLSCLHLPFVLWSMLGIVFVGKVGNDSEKRLGFLTYNGDLLVMMALILLSGAILSSLTVGLFSLIGFNIGEFYFKNVGIVGLAAAPLVGTYLTRTNPQLVGKVSPVIAKIFSPLVLVMLIVYLIATAYSGKDPYNDREFLLIFNALLVGVMALIFFAIAETTKATKSRAAIWILFLLAVVTIIANSIALSAISFRISEWGITPNRAAVLGANALILVNLLLVTIQLFRVLFKKADTSAVGKVIAFYLPVYCLWAMIVTFLFPLLFGFA
ncbi:hypothetical protein [Parapedobacter koreensis]|uniref:DUF4153 domain-containing protein n=1 Tax=Parapedobacter koreensis TaxID=332977 RepID=A0A1H7U944_9SPHI|nr:hypothetical protein [Parapedobacter koreensis]SEL92797.1 hypothetical protein SAMN05421740_1147 [Parapedobacter koreensis]